MTYEALVAGISRLIKARAAAHGNDREQTRINAKLTKLYDLKYTMLQQMANSQGGNR